MLDSHMKTCAVNGTSNTLRHRPEDALNNQQFNRQQVCTVVQHVWTTTRNSHWQRPTICRTAIRRHVQWMEHQTHYDIAQIYSIERSDRETSQDVKGDYPEVYEDRKWHANRFATIPAPPVPAHNPRVRGRSVWSWGCTPLDSNLSSPREIIFNWPIRTTLPSHHPTLMQQNQQQLTAQRPHDTWPRPTCRSTEILTCGVAAKSWLSAQSHVRTLFKPQTAQGYAELRALQAENILNEATEHTRRRATFREDNTDERQVAPPVTTTGEPPPDEATSLAPAIRPSGRMIRKPSRFQE